MAEFWILAEWPPYSPDLNLLDFSVWSVLQEKVQPTPHTALVALRRSITRQWNWTCRSFRHHHRQKDGSAKDQNAPISPFQGYQKLQ
jgi:hypothetical protein